MQEMNTYKDLIVWRKSIGLASAIYDLSSEFPKEEVFGLTSQMRRAAVSISSNIAEGKLRGHKKECKQFFSIAFGSGGELETQVEIAKTLPNTKNLDYSAVDSLLDEVMKMLNKMIRDLSLTPKV